MARTAIKSIGAVLLGFAVIFTLSSGVDAGLEATDILPRGALPGQSAELLILGVLEIIGRLNQRQPTLF